MRQVCKCCEKRETAELAYDAYCGGKDTTPSDPIPATIVTWAVVCDMAASHQPIITNHIRLTLLKNSDDDAVCWCWQWIMHSRIWSRLQRSCFNQNCTHRLKQISYFGRKHFLMKNWKNCLRSPSVDHLRQDNHSTADLWRASVIRKLHSGATLQSTLTKLCVTTTTATFFDANSRFKSINTQTRFSCGRRLTKNCGDW